MLTLKKVKELVGAPSHAKRTPSPKMLYEEGIVLLRREFDQGSHLTVYNSGYVLFSAGKRNTVFHIHDCCGDYAYDAAEGKGDVIEEEYFENCEWHIRALFEGERKMEDNQAKCEGAGRSNVCVSYHALSEDWSEIADRTINMLEKIIENEAVHAMLAVLTDKQRDLMDAVTGLFQPIGEQGGAALCGSVFKVEYTDCGQRRVYLRLYSGTLRLRDTVALAGREKLKITEMRIPSKGEIVRTDTAYPGEIVILPSDSVRLNDVLGDQTRLPRKRWREDPLPMLRTTIAPKTAAQRERLLDALTQLADTDPLLRCEVDSITHEIILSFLGRVQLEVVSALLSEKYKLETVVKEPTVIYMERPLKAASHTIHIEVPPNPFWASIGLSVTPLPLGSGVQYESRVSLGYLNQSFQNAVRDGIRYGLEQGLFGWNVTDCKICFEYGLYYSPVSTPADFRSLAPIVLEQALKESGTQLLEPYLSFILYAPQEYLSRAYHDAPKYCATIETAQVKKDEVVFTGEIPARCIQAYRTDLAFYTNGQSVCLTELKGYQAAVGQPVIQPRRPNSRLDKVRHMFQKVM